MVLKKFVLIVTAIVCAAGSLCAQSNKDVYSYINAYKELAVHEMQRTGVPAAVKLAQGIHETQAGKSDLVQRSNNHFGIKCKANWSGDKVYHDDDARGECFRSYATCEESYADHSNFLKGSSRYAFLFELDPTDYKAWAYGLKKAGYATNIRYSQIIIKLIEDYNLEQYTLIAMGKLSPQEEVLVGDGKPIGSGNVSTTVFATPVFVKKEEVPVTTVAVAASVMQYPAGEFTINNTRVVFARSGTSLLAIARQYDISLSRLLDFNDMREEDVLENDQLLYLQRKRKVGAGEFHTVQSGESLYTICQSEGLRYESLVNYNHLDQEQLPAVGEKLYLQAKAPARPKLASEVTAVNAGNSVAAAGYTTHTVESKETLYSIARKYDVSVENLKSWNRLAGYDVKIGQELIIYKN
ncbi:MAG: LysM peptidoglycan-binding domain-containing protein [Chitinophagaceae bacterium]